MLLCISLMAVPLHSLAGIRMHCQMQGNNNLFEDERACLSLQVTLDGRAELRLYNKTSEPLTVDRTHSFGYVNDESFTLFVPSAHTESFTEDYGTLDIVRFGHTGHAQTGTYRGESHTSSHTEWDRPFQPVAPFGSAVIYVFPQLHLLMSADRIDIGRRGNLLGFGRKGHFIDPLTGRRTKFRKGSEAVFTESTTPLHIAAHVQYFLESETPSSADTHSAHVSDFVRCISAGGRMSQTDGSFSFVSGGGNGFLATELGVGATLLGIIGYTLWDFNSFMPDFGSF